MLDRRNRLTTGAGFSTATGRGRRAGTRTLVLHLASGDPGRELRGSDGTAPAGDQPVRVGFVVSKAVGNAVTRNRVKRRLRHLAGARLPAVPVRSLLVVRALPPAADATYDALGRDFDVALRRLELTVDGTRRGGRA